LWNRLEIGPGTRSVRLVALTGGVFTWPPAKTYSPLNCVFSPCVASSNEVCSCCISVVPLPVAMALVIAEIELVAELATWFKPVS